MTKGACVGVGLSQHFIPRHKIGVLGENCKCALLKDTAKKKTPIEAYLILKVLIKGNNGTI